MKRQFTSLRKTKIRFGSTFTCREGVSTPTAPVKSVPLNQMWFLKIGSKWFLKFDTYKLITLKTCVHFLLFFISLCGIVNEDFWIRSIKHIDNCRQCLILLIVPQDFLFKDNCNSSKNLSSVIRNYIPKINLFKISYFFIILFFTSLNMKTIV